MCLFLIPDKNSLLYIKSDSDDIDLNASEEGPNN